MVSMNKYPGGGWAYKITETERDGIFFKFKSIFSVLHDLCLLLKDIYAFLRFSEKKNTANIHEICMAASRLGISASEYSYLHT